jgi:hypothetical protein
MVIHEVFEKPSGNLKQTSLFPSQLFQGSLHYKEERHR